MRKKRPAHARSHVPTRTLSGVIGGKKQFSENRSLRAEEVSFSNRAREGARPVKVPSPPTMEGGEVAVLAPHPGCGSADRPRFSLTFGSPRGESGVRKMQLRNAQTTGGELSIHGQEAWI